MRVSKLIWNILLKMKGFEKLSDNLSYAEATRSNTAKRYGISNEPDLRQLRVMKHLAVNLFQVVRDFFDSPIYVSSFYRSRKLNEIIGGVVNSDHCVNEDVAAIDLDNDGFNEDGVSDVTNADIFWYIYDNLDYYKLIWEFGDDNKPAWVHISFSEDPNKNKRKLTYRAIRGHGRTSYVTFKDHR